jgi:elongation factor Ts
MAITPQQVKELRERTGLGMMACQKALIETNGDAEAAIEILRKRGELKAAKKAERTASDGSIAIILKDNNAVGAMLELACETDFVARNPEFVALAEELARRASERDFDGIMTPHQTCDAQCQETHKMVEALIAKMGENMKVQRVARIKARDGVLGSYLHSNRKIGVIVELAVGADARGKAEVASLARDICMQIASLNPVAVRPEEVPADIIENEKAIYREQVKDKPAAMQEKIAMGKLTAYFKDTVLLEQAFVKEPKKSVKQHIADVATAAGAKIDVVRFVRFQIGQQ